jgi:hypothetical protein
VAELIATPLPHRWVDAADSVLQFFGRIGLEATISGRTLKLSGVGIPNQLMEKAGIALLSLDRFSKGQINPVVMEGFRHLAVSVFDQGTDEILKLLDEHEGPRVLAKLLGRVSRPSPQRTLETEILNVLRRTKTDSLVHFESGGGYLAARLAASLPSLKHVTVDSSLLRFEKARSRTETLADALFGSVEEIHAKLPNNAFALLIDSLSPVGDARLENAEQTLFASQTFKWILLVEAGSQRRNEWAHAVCEARGFRHTSWKVGGSNSAYLFRREGDPKPSRFNTSRPPSAIETRVLGPVKIAQEQWNATLETFSKWTVDPRWLLYLPPGMCARQADRSDGYLEHPSDALEYYRLETISKVVMELKHMGSRAIAVVCRNEETATKRFGGDGYGCIYTRNGRAFFGDATPALQALREGLSRAGFWKQFATDWVCLDGELLPWSLKAEALLEETHGDILTAKEAEYRIASEVLARIAPEEVEALKTKAECLAKYRRLYERYRAEKDSAMQFAPFHLIAVEGRSFFDKNHLWHMSTLNALARRAGEPFVETPYKLVSLKDCESASTAIAWWEELSAAGSEGVVIKPLPYIPRGRRGLAQPALKCRGKEHLRLVYGAEYDLPENRVRLIDRAALANRRNKHRRVLKQAALSIEAVERFVRLEPLDRVRECVRAIASLETRENHSSSQSSDSASSR